MPAAWSYCPLLPLPQRGHPAATDPCCPRAARARPPHHQRPGAAGVIELGPAAPAPICPGAARRSFHRRRSTWTSRDSDQDPTALPPSIILSLDAVGRTFGPSLLRLAPAVLSISISWPLFMGNRALQEPLLYLPFSMVAIKAAAAGTECSTCSMADTPSLPAPLFCRSSLSLTQPPFPYGGDHQPCQGLSTCFEYLRLDPPPRR